MLLHPLGVASSPPLQPGEPITQAVSSVIEGVARACVGPLRSKLQLTLFGFDLIHHRAGSDRPHDHDTFFIVDINYFPSYKTMTGLPEKLIAICLKKRAQEAAATATAATAE
jgi:hypothetical protein